MINKIILITVIFILINLNLSKCKHHNLININSLNNTREASKIIYLVPKESNEIYQINELSEFKFNTVNRKGWLLESNKNYNFKIFLKLENVYLNSTQKAGFVYPVLLEELYYIYFTKSDIHCDDFRSHTHVPIVISHNITKRSPKYFIYEGEFETTLSHLSNEAYYICLQNSLSSEFEFLHQGTEYWLTFITYEDYLSKWQEIIFYILLVCLAAVFNGLNLGLMSWSVEELNIIMKTSDSMRERKYAENILPLRKNGNFLLCAILISTTLTSSASTLLLDDLTDGILAGILSTLILCIFSEVLPQSIFSKYSLPITSYFRYFTYLFLYLTAPISYPFSKIIDCVLGKELPTECSRDKIKELIKYCKVLNDHECKILTGALDFKNRTVFDVMVKLDDVFMLEEDIKLNFDTMLCIHNSGYSRIPVYKKYRNQLIGWFHVKDLSLIDSNDELPLKDFMKMFKRKVAISYTTDKLIDMFEVFRIGETHLAFVIEIIQDEDVDPYPKCIGIITLHDVIEALVQLDIYDENTYFKQVVDSYNESKNDSSGSIITSTSKFSESINRPLLIPQLRLSLFQLLHSIKPFKEEFISNSVLEQAILNDSNVVKIIIPNQVNINEENHYVYKYHKPCNYFIMIIEGHLILEVGKEKTEILVKPFEYFGVKALLGDCRKVDEITEKKSTYKPYSPEFSLKINYRNYYYSDSKRKSDHYQYVVYLKIDRSLWLNAINATKLKRNSQKLSV